MSYGNRGLKGGSSLLHLLVERRGVKHRRYPSPLSIRQILARCDAHRKRTGRWPTSMAGPIANVPDENWRAVDDALRKGSRGLPGGSSLARLLGQERGAPPRLNFAPYSVDEILRWADGHHARQGRWPTCYSGPIPEAPGETWRKIHNALYDGVRGLPGGSSLARILTDERGARKIRHLLPLSADLILDWADAHYARTGQWPKSVSGLIPEAPGETWQTIHGALYYGTRGLGGRSTLARLLNENRGVAGLRGKQGRS